MSSPATALLSCFGKLLRARSHIHELVEAMAEFRKKTHYAFVRYDNRQDHTDPILRVQWRVRVIEPIPDSWAYIVGDVVNNLRSALDHALAEVARRRIGLTDAEVQTHKLQFPICDAPGKFREFERRNRSLLPSDVVDALKKLQPYQYQNSSPELNLQALRDLSNLDKHRELTVVAQGVYESAVKSDPPLEVIEESVNTGPLTEGMVFATVKWRRPANPVEMELTPEVRYVESLFTPWRQDYWPVGVVLEMVYREAVFAVEELVRAYMGPMDLHFMWAFLQVEEKNREKMFGTLVTDDELREILTGRTPRSHPTESPSS